MKPEPFDHAPLVKAWLDEPVWLPESDLGRLAAIVHQTPQQRGWLPPVHRRSFRTMLSASSYVIAGVSVALLGGVLLNGAVSPQPDQPMPPAASLAASPAVESTSPSVAPTAETSTGSVTADGVVMGAPSGASVAGWAEIGRTSTVNGEGMSLSDLRDPVAVGDQLVALGTIEETAEGPSHPVVLRSADGLTWQSVTVPGSDPIVTELAASSSGLLAGGSEIRDGERAGALWTSPDGLTWTPIADIPFAQVRQIVSADLPMVVIDDVDRPYVWVSEDGGASWSTSRRLNDFSIAKGPGGFLMWRGGGQDRTVPTRLLHSADATDFTEVGLPAALAEGRDAQAGVTVFPLADQWVLVPSEVKLPDSIYTSTDGVTWAEAPRPTRMTEDVRWIATVGDQTQAFGYATAIEEDPSDLVPTPTAIWTWQVGEASAEPTDFDPAGDDVLQAPVAFGDGSVAVGFDGGGPGLAITVWRYDPAAS
jgi:hypothetical protein